MNADINRMNTDINRMNRDINRSSITNKHNYYINNNRITRILTNYNKLIHNYRISADNIHNTNIRSRPINKNYNQIQIQIQILIQIQTWEIQMWEIQIIIICYKIVI